MKGLEGPEPWLPPSSSSRHRAQEKLLERHLAEKKSSNYSFPFFAFPVELALNLNPKKILSFFFRLNFVPDTLSFEAPTFWGLKE